MMPNSLLAHAVTNDDILLLIYFVSNARYDERTIMVKDRKR